MKNNLPLILILITILFSNIVIAQTGYVTLKIDNPLIITSVNIEENQNSITCKYQTNYKAKNSEILINWNINNQKTNITNETILPEKNKKYSCTTTIKTKDNTIQKTSETYIFQENTKLNLDTEKTKTTTLQKITGNVINLKNIEKTQTWQYTSLTISIILITLLVIILRKKHKN